MLSLSTEHCVDCSGNHRLLRYVISRQYYGHIKCMIRPNNVSETVSLCSNLFSCIFRQMWQHYTNMKPVFLANWDDKLISKLKTFFSDQSKWTNSMINKYGNKDPYWRHVGYINSHFNGLYAGYKQVAEKGWVS